MFSLLSSPTFHRRKITLSARRFIHLRPADELDGLLLVFLPILCLLELDGRRVVRNTEGACFCCEGCRAVYGFIRSEGLTDFYEKRRQEWKVTGPVEAGAIEDMNYIADVLYDRKK